MSFKEMTSKVMASINRAINFPAVLVMKALSAIGITGAITRAATKDIRKDRLMRASLILVSLELGFMSVALILVSLGFSRVNTVMEATAIVLRLLVIALTAGSILFFRYNKVVRKHRESDIKRCIARSRKAG